jgi:hypothetical protein
LWLTCHDIRNNKTITSLQIGHDYSFFTHPKPLDIYCFKSFKTTFKGKKEDESIVKNNHLEPNKVMLTSWVDWELEQALSKRTYKIGLGL